MYFVTWFTSCGAGVFYFYPIRLTQFANVWWLKRLKTIYFKCCLYAPTYIYMWAIGYLGSLRLHSFPLVTLGNKSVMVSGCNRVTSSCDTNHASLFTRFSNFSLRVLTILFQMALWRSCICNEHEYCKKAKLIQITLFPSVSSWICHGWCE